MRAMPSPTSRTRPTSRASSLARYWSISVCRTETISSALNLMAASFDDLFPDVLQLGTDRPVIHPVADLHHQAAEQFRIDAGFQDRFLLELLPELLHEALALVVGQWHRTLYLDAQAPNSLVAQLLRLRQDRTEHSETVVVVQDEEEVEEDVAGPALKGRADQGFLLAAADGSAGQKRLELRLGREQVVYQRVELVEDFLRLSLFLGGVEECSGGNPGD